VTALGAGVGRVKMAAKQNKTIQLGNLTGK